MYMYNFILMSIIMFNTMIMISNHPLSMTILIIIQTLCLSFMLAPISQSFWFSYMMILILLGGMLILFIYITTLASNELMKMSRKFIMSIITSWMTMFIIIFIFNSFNLHFNPMKSDSIIKMYGEINMESQKTLSQIYNFPNESLTILTIIYLLITLIVVVNITQMQKGPLRQMS
uniref:NADH-ubiquinone oxidoreductase chain 6 n=1 Tax=Truljalia hibinonis TaxID=1982313 RepID=A0A1W6QZ91_9ORTH|nr:NADH dehydrogenase subunit 6 [Truljalia hibinonis]ARO46898.1 NADH dehydrogenase subunit 6 [Truljalia hibinonis]